MVRRDSLTAAARLPGNGLAAYGGDLMPAGARRIVNGEEDADSGPVEAVFAQARDAEDNGEEFLVDDGWQAVVDSEPVVTAVHVNEVNGRNRPKAGSPCSPGPGSRPRNWLSRRDAAASPSPRPCPSSSGRWSPSGNGRRSRSVWGDEPTGIRGGNRTVVSSPLLPAPTCSRPNFRVHVPVAGTEQCGRPPSHQDETGRKAATEKLHPYTSTKGEPEGPTDEAPP